MSLSSCPPPPSRGCGPRHSSSSTGVALTRSFPALIFLLLTLYVSTSLQQHNPIKDFCRRFGHQTAVIDRKLYIDGGLVNWNPIPQNPANYTNSWLLYQDLDHDSVDGMPQLYANLSKNSTIPDLNGGTLWADDVNKRFYLFGGEYYQNPPEAFTLYGYDVLENNWDDFGSPQPNLNLVSYGAGAAISERGEGYYYGGWLSNNSVPGWTGPPVATNGLVKYEMDQNSWTNNTGPDSTRRAEGQMVYIPASDGGMLVYFGGVKDPYLNGTVVGQPMEQIFVYDILSSKWYKQNATGTIPGMRGRFCAGATWAPDQSSYNIYLYGGSSMPPSTSGWDDVYILTLPTFQYIKLFPTDGNVTGPSPHHSLACNVVSNAQMLIIGGTFPTSDDCDAPQQWGTHNIDLGEQNKDKAMWQLFVPNLTTYAVPDPVVSAVGGSAGGGATKTAPTGGFNNADLSVLMTRTASIPSRTPTRAIPNTTGTSGSGGPGLSTGAIIGIAVGGGVVLIALVVGLCCWARRHRRRHYKAPPGGSSSNRTYSESDGAPWSPHPSMRRGTHPSSPYGRRVSPFAPMPSPPAELPASSANLWTGPDGVTYEMVQSPGLSPAGAHAHAFDQPRPKIDEFGRVWVPHVSMVHMTTGRRASEVHSHSSSPSYGGGGGGGGGGLGGYFRQGAAGDRYSPVAPNSPPRRPLSPQELSTDPMGDAAGVSWDAAHGRPVHDPSLTTQHTTYYHR